MVKDTRKKNSEKNRGKNQCRRRGSGLKRFISESITSFNGVFRDFQSTFLTRRHLKLALASIIVGVLGGLAAAAFLFLIDFFTNFMLYYPQKIWAPLIIFIPAIGGLLVALITYKFAPESEGHGISEVMESIVRRRGRIRARVPLVKMVTSAITIGTGGSAGTEGPIVQMVGGVGQCCSKD